MRLLMLLIIALMSMACTMDTEPHTRPLDMNKTLGTNTTKQENSKTIDNSTKQDMLEKDNTKGYSPEEEEQH